MVAQTRGVTGARRNSSNHTGFGDIFRRIRESPYNGNVQFESDSVTFAPLLAKWSTTTPSSP